ncbi:hypothetical protein ANCCAN_00035 [Ancylostoma caninum]|uniref:Fibrinogen C-terminal domain-containing protein n=1 Tax=Ancylostoma caninum TaxID=29170 RepID=A0A368HAA8_ANCCA|nr:hypothetical protein ANCCAN_00035 [Ancylostoma caninum]
MRKYSSDVKTNGKDTSELDPCLAARSRVKKSFCGRWKKWITIAVLLFILLLAITVGFLVFFLSPWKEDKPTMEYVHHEIQVPQSDYDVEDIEAQELTGSRPLQYNRHKPYKNDKNMVFQSFDRKEPAHNSREEFARDQRMPPHLGNPILVEVITTTSTATTVTYSDFATKTTAAKSVTPPPVRLQPPMTSTTTTTSTTTATTTRPPLKILPAEPEQSDYDEHADAPNKPVTLMSTEVKKDCSAHLKDGGTSGVYLISPDGADAFQAYCDQETVGGGWTVIQRRISKSVYFYNRTWQQYEEGFGNLEGSHWLGLSKIYRLAPHEGDNWILRIELHGDYCSGGRGCLNEKDGYWWAEWPFKLSDASTGYVLDLGTATAGNLTVPGTQGLLEKFNSGRAFTTIDRDNDPVKTLNCAQFRNFGGWWHGDCGFVALNGIYGDSVPTLRYMVYTYIDSRAGHKKYFIHPKKSIMMIRPGSSL